MLTVIWQSPDNSIISKSTSFTEVTSSVMLTILAFGGFRITQGAVSITLTWNAGAQSWSRSVATRLRLQAIKSWHACLTRQTRIAWGTITSFYQASWRRHRCYASLFGYLHRDLRNPALSHDVSIGCLDKNIMNIIYNIQEVFTGHRSTDSRIIAIIFPFFLCHFDFMPCQLAN